MANDVFLSYARRDDEDGAVAEFVTQLVAKYGQFTGGNNLEVFRDRTGLEFGEAWKSRIIEESNQAPFLLALLSPSYLRSDSCAFEWDLYTKRYEGDVSPGLQLIIPIEFIDLGLARRDDEIVAALDLTEAQQRRFSYAKQLQIGSWWSARFERDTKDKFFHELSARIRRLTSLLGAHKRRGRNTHRIHGAIDDLARTNEPAEWRDLLIAVENKKRDHSQSVDPVCVIYTGGTVGMVRQDRNNLNSELIIGNLTELEDHLPKLRMLPFDIHLYSYREPIDSSAITPADWVLLARIIRELYRVYQGFVILHGTNTMAYTASALSFMFSDLSKPVILTGAELPLIDWHSDAEQNVLRALEIAAPNSERAIGIIPEVCLAFGNTLLRGNRATKYHSTDTVNAFYSPNYPELGSIGAKDLTVNHKVVRRIDDTDTERLEVRGTDFKHKVMIIDVYPDFDLDYYSSGLDNPGLAGLIIRTYGSGNVPEKPSALLEKLETLINRGVVVVNLTQCPKGRTELRLFETSARLYDVGVINGGDMTTEAAYCKLKVLLAKNLATEEVRRLMQIDERGELTLSAYHVQYPEKEGPYGATPTFLGHSRPTDSFRFRALDIDHAFLRVQGVKVIGSATDEEVLVKIYYHVPDSVDITGPAASYREVGEFVKTVSIEQPMSHNLEVTGKLRQLYRKDTHVSLQLHSAKGQSLQFESLQLSIFTRE